MIDTVHIGIGPLGQKVLRYAVERGCFNVVGAVDSDPDKAGKDLGQLCGIEKTMINDYFLMIIPIGNNQLSLINNHFKDRSGAGQARPGLKTMAQIPPIAYFK
jgi:hypothetical protein